MLIKSPDPRNDREKHRFQKSTITGAIVGGLAGVVTGILDVIGVWDIPQLIPSLSVDPFAPIITGTLSGVFIGAGIGTLVGDGITPDKAEHNGTVASVVNYPNRKTTLQVREEQLDIKKKTIQTGKVTMHKEAYEEEKNIVVPLTHEELVIEKKIFDIKDPNKVDSHTETIRIPIKEERIEVIKHPVVLNDVSIYKRQYQENKSIEETLKKEKVHVELIGEPKIINKESEKNL